MPYYGFPPEGTHTVSVARRIFEVFDDGHPDTKEAKLSCAVCFGIWEPLVRWGRIFVAIPTMDCPTSVDLQDTDFFPDHKYISTLSSPA